MFAVHWCRRACSISQTALVFIGIVKNIGPYWKRPYRAGRQIGGKQLALSRACHSIPERTYFYLRRGRNSFYPLVVRELGTHLASDAGHRARPRT
jgi:hypothetical protein